MNKRRKILAAMLAAFMLLVPMVSTAQIDIKGDGGETSDLSGTWGTSQITDYQTEEYVPLGEGLWLLAGAAGLYLLVKSRKTRKATAVAAAALALTLGTTQCKKTEESVIPAGETISISFLAGNGAKADISVYTGRITWNSGDKVYVVYDGKLLSETPLLATPDSENPVNASISGTITTAVTIGANPSFTFYYVGSGVTFDKTNFTFDIQNQNGIDAGHYMVGRTEAVEMEKNEGGTYVPSEDGAKHFDPLTSVLRLDTKAFGACQMTMSGGNSQMKIDLANPGTPIYNPGPITFTGDADARISVIPTTAPDVNVNVTLNFSGNGKVGSITVKNGIKEGRIYSKVANNAGYPIPVEAIDGVLPGLFSVSATEYIRFAKGNLFCTRSGSEGSYTYSFGLEPNQYDFRTRPGNYAVKNGVILATGTESNESGLFQYDLSCAVEGGDFGAFGTKNPVPGNASQILNYGKAIGPEWYTLTKEEWDYILSTHAFVWCRVKGIYGCALAPDDYDITTLPWTTTDNELNNWEKAEAYGVAFIPAAGFMQGEGENFGGLYVDGTIVPFSGYSWTSTTLDPNSAYYFGFGIAEINTFSHVNSYAFPERLVQKFEKLQ